MYPSQRIAVREVICPAGLPRCHSPACRFFLTSHIFTSCCGGTMEKPLAFRNVVCTAEHSGIQYPI